MAAAFGSSSRCLRIGFFPLMDSPKRKRKSVIRKHNWPSFGKSKNIEKKCFPLRESYLLEWSAETVHSIFDLGVDLDNLVVTDYEHEAHDPIFEIQVGKYIRF